MTELLSTATSKAIAVAPAASSRSSTACSTALPELTVDTQCMSGSMPKTRPKWSAADLAKLAAWISAGAKNN